jgi:hypothetical protein
MTGGSFDPAPILRHNRDVAGTLKDGAQGGGLWSIKQAGAICCSPALMAALPLGVAGAAGSPLNPEQTIIKPSDGLQSKNIAPLSCAQCR